MFEVNTESEILKMFDEEEIYLALNPDVAYAGMSAIDHYLRYGRKEKRVVTLPSVIGINSFSPLRPTIMIVSHEASRTGAPVLSLNVAQKFTKKFNVVNLLLGSGAIEHAFESQSSAYLVACNLKLHAPITSVLVHRLCQRFNFKFAIVNSIESRVVLEELSKNDVPTVSLIHEFASYTRPHDAFRRALLWSNEVVFSAKIVRDNAISEYPDLGARHSHILPQGRCSLPEDDEVLPGDFERECDRIRSLMRPKGIDPNTVIILGAGFVQIRKGVDLFIECATRVMHSPGGENCRFVWIGKGYDPNHDVAYSVYLKDQIERSGLKDHLIFIGETPAIEAAYKEADLFLLSSRLDPLPNVAIEVMSHGVPVLCFDKTTGIADFLIDNKLRDFCVAQYIDTAEMAQKILSLANSKPLYQSISERCQKAVLEYFDMDRYIAQLESLGSNAVTQFKQEKIDVQTILDSGLFQVDFAGYPYEASASPKDHVRSYVRSWASGIGRRKPCSGFHPGIYLEQHGVRFPGSDPFADYIREGCPDGAWHYPVISEQVAIDVQNLPNDQRIALHVHAYYPELLTEIVGALAFNQIKPDLFISVRDEAAVLAVQEMLQDYFGQVKEVQIVPNLGRDIGPFLTQFGKTLLEQYEFVGHLHTKKSAAVEDPEMGQAWYCFLLKNLLGTSEFAMADAILSKLHTDPAIGIIFPDDPNVMGWEGNEIHANQLAQKMEIEQLPKEFLFPIGTMFWAKTDALKELINLNLNWNDYPMEPLPYDGSVLHAIERLVGVPRQHYGVATTHVSGTTR